MSSRRNKAFTLIELLISLALMIMLMLGVNYIFTSVGTATGNAQSFSRINRDIQAAQPIMVGDFGGTIGDAPCLLISSQIQQAYRSKSDELAGEDPSIHRTDIISFFSRGSFPRMTGPEGYYVADQTSTEAWIWYGHLRLADNGSGYNRMGEGTSQSNPNNYYASQWALGRVAMLMMDTTGFTQNTTDITQVGTISAGGIPQRFIARAGSAGSDSKPKTLAPLAQGSQSDDGKSKISDSRYDLAGVSVPHFKTILTNYIALNPDTSLPAGDWWGRLMLDDTPVDVFVGPLRRFRADPYLRGQSMTSEIASQHVPLFLEHCSSFIVEYAGDFCTQDQTGTVTAYAPDGELDYIPGPAGSTVPTRIVRWYGMPRDVNGDGVIRGAGPSVQMVDVVPLRDVLAGDNITLPYTSNSQFKFFERAWPVTPPPANYVSVMPADSVAGSYRVAWGPDTTDQQTPSMIRLIISLDDANGRVNEPVTTEYVFKLK